MALHQARAKGLHYAKPGVCFATVCLSVYFTLAPTATSPPPDRALHWLLLFPPSPYRSPAAHPPLCGRQAVHRPPGGPAFSRLAYGQSGPTRALERPHRGSTPTSDFCGTYVRPPQRIPTPKNPMPAPPSFKCRGPWHGNQRDGYAHYPLAQWRNGQWADPMLAHAGAEAVRLVPFSSLLGL